MARYLFSKNSNLGIARDEGKAGFAMLWQKEEKIKEKLKRVENIYKGDDSLFDKTVKFHIWMFNPITGDTSRIDSRNFNRMSEAYAHFA